METSEYQCELDESSNKKAWLELHEDPKERLGAASTLREWVRQQDWLRTPTDDKYLLSFLRARKFSQLGARELLENYWTVRTKLPEWYSDVDPADNKPSEKSFDDVMRANLALFDYLLLDENIQVNGFVFIVDLTGFTRQHFMATGVENSKKCMLVTQKALPGRIKELHYYNTGSVFETIFNLIRPLMSEKLRNRVHVHGQNLTTVYDKIDMSLLPEEYLPDDYEGPKAGCIQDIADNLAKSLLQPKIKKFIVDLHSGKYGVDLSKKSKDSEPQASFRKLNVS
ncbi:hypothetical protein ACJMK2_010803 [Sinanodonta woodiana]|uniref:CRAL-TRIO domain-containing protein n=1 Tax=Sinanodonta woodiana TaxID=1069815 RepID=A0ABD3VI38_SINWO